MIERCTKKQMLVSIILLIGLSVAIVLLEHHLTTTSFASHQHVAQTEVENIPTVAVNQCWLSENFSVIEECQPCTDFEKTSKYLDSCESNGYKEKVHCDISGDTFRRYA